MTVLYYLVRGGCWPYSLGASHGGFTRIGPLAMAEGGLQPRMGADTNRPVSPSVLPFFDVFRYGWFDNNTPADPTDDTYVTGAQGGYNCWRIYAQVNGGPNTLIYASGNPYIGTWNSGNNMWDYVLDTASEHYLVSPAGWSAGWSHSIEGDGPAYGHFKPSDPLYATTCRRMQLLKATPWDVGAWAITIYEENNPTSGTADHGPTTLNDGFTFIVAEEGGGSYDLEADIETTPGWCPSYVVGTPPPPPVNVPPIVSDVTPAPGTPIHASDSISLKVTDTSGLFRRVLLTAQIAGQRATEVIHDGDRFTNLYAGISSRVATTVDGRPGFQYVIARLGGWPGSPTIEAYAIDQQGAENA